jgi:hypothetical protein
MDGQTGILDKIKLMGCFTILESADRDFNPLIPAKAGTQGLEQNRQQGGRGYV